MYRIYSILMGYSNTVSCDVDTVLDKKMKKYNFLSLENIRFVKLTKKDEVRIATEKFVFRYNQRLKKDKASNIV